MNKHKIAWIALAAGIVFVIMLTWLVGVSPQISHIKSSDAQTAQIDENNKETRDEIETLRIASETIGLQKDRLRQLQRQIPDGYNQQEFINSLDASAAGTGVAIKSVNFDDAVDADIPAEMQGTIQAGQLVQVSVSITATGSYDAMRNFVASVQNINRIAVPENVTYTLDRNGDETKNAVVIDCKIWSLLLACKDPKPFKPEGALWLYPNSMKSYPSPSVVALFFPPVKSMVEPVPRGITVRSALR